MSYLSTLSIWFRNLFTKNGRKENYYTKALNSIKKVAKKNVLTRFNAKRMAIKKVRFWQSGPKKSNYELMQLALHSGLKASLENSGVKTDWYKMKFLN